MLKLHPFFLMSILAFGLFSCSSKEPNQINNEIVKAKKIHLEDFFRAVWKFEEWGSRTMMSICFEGSIINPASNEAKTNRQKAQNKASSMREATRQPITVQEKYRGGEGRDFLRKFA